MVVTFNCLSFKKRHWVGLNELSAVTLSNLLLVLALASLQHHSPAVLHFLYSVQILIPILSIISLFCMMSALNLVKILC